MENQQKPYVVTDAVGSLPPLWEGQARDALDALDRFADAEGFATYSDQLGTEEGDALLGDEKPDGSRWAIFTNTTVWAIPRDVVDSPTYGSGSLLDEIDPAEYREKLETSGFFGPKEASPVDVVAEAEALQQDFIDDRIDAAEYRAKLDTIGYRKEAIVFDVESGDAPVPIGTYVRTDEDVVVYRTPSGEYRSAPYDCVRVEKPSDPDDLGVHVVDPAGWVTRDGRGPYATKDDAIAATKTPLPDEVEWALDEIAEDALAAAFALIAARLGLLGFPVTGDFAPDEEQRLGIEFRGYVRRMALNNPEIAKLSE